ncbi:uncharacterized protein LOC5501290 isoform X2 [Nematostella vectensis]|uniref:uncharacterized protein LOC5501290 isoform X2 n=1 Tax=Nematostella vectensis TaxID=45351 RepID=UPI0020778CD2|nr:uncharacterized protein LOC5501290 isoform X2 [Nematostella vectensis]
MNVTRGKSSVIILRLIVILQGTSSISGVDKECESCYSFHDDIMSWLLSRQQCSVAGGDLVVMETKEEWAFITEQIQTKTVPDGSNESFIGMEIPDNWKKGEPLKWKNGANFTLTDKWQSGKPTANEGEQRTSSVLISRDYMFKGSLNSIRYDLQRGRICEYKKDCSQAGRVPRCISPTTETLTTETIAASQLTPSSSATTTTIRTNTKTTESAITTSLSTSLPVILPKESSTIQSLSTPRDDAPHASSKSSSALSLEVLVVLVLLSVACIILIIIVCVWKHQHREKKRPRKSSTSRKNAIPVTIIHHAHREASEDENTRGADYIDTHEHMELAADPGTQPCVTNAVIHPGSSPGTTDQSYEDIADASGGHVYDGIAGASCGVVYDSAPDLESQGSSYTNSCTASYSSLNELVHRAFATGDPSSRETPPEPVYARVNKKQKIARNRNYGQSGDCTMHQSNAVTGPRRYVNLNIDPSMFPNSIEIEQNASEICNRLPVDILTAPGSERPVYARVHVGEEPQLITGEAIVSKQQPMKIEHAPQVLDSGPSDDEHALSIGDYLYAVVDKRNKTPRVDPAGSPANTNGYYADLADLDDVDDTSRDVILPPRYEPTDYAEIVSCQVMDEGPHK